MATKRNPMTRADISEALRERWPSLPIAAHPPTLPERIARAEVEVDRLMIVAKKRRAAKP